MKNYTTLHTRVIQELQARGLILSFGTTTPRLDGIRLEIPEVEPSVDSLFLMLHMAGHCAQWRDSAYARGLAVIDAESFRPEFAASVIEYELNGTVYGVSMLSTDLRDELWDSMMDAAAQDVRMLLGVYFGGEIPPESKALIDHLRHSASAVPVSTNPFIRWELLSRAAIL